jgi:hypothetical protein
MVWRAERGVLKLATTMIALYSCAIGSHRLSVTGAVEGGRFLLRPDPSNQLACAIAGNILIIPVKVPLPDTA